MNTRLGKSFGLAFVVAVGILALMFALGTFKGGGARSRLGSRRLYLRYPEHAGARCHRRIHGNVQGGGSNQRL